MSENWSPVTVEGLSDYEVSDMGRVRRGGALVPTRLNRGSGYIQVHMRLAGKQRCFNVHRLVALAFLGPPPPGHECDHIDRNRANPVLSNLRWVTRSQNCLGRRVPYGWTRPFKRGIRCGVCREPGHTKSFHEQLEAR